MSISVWSSDVCASDRDAAYDGGRRQSGWQSKGRERCRPAKPREALPPPCQASAGLFLEARVQQAEMWQSDLGRVAAPAQPSLLELALGDHALVVVEKRVDLIEVDDGGLVAEVAQQAVEEHFAGAGGFDAGGTPDAAVAEARR